MLTETRYYRFSAHLLDAYENWSRTEAMPFLSKNLRGWGFGIVVSADPVNHMVQSAADAATATWVFRWSDIYHRSETISGVFAGREWLDIMGRMPGGAESYDCVDTCFESSTVAA